MSTWQPQDIAGVALSAGFAIAIALLGVAAVIYAWRHR